MITDAMIQQCAPDVALSTMRAIVRVESSGDPYAIGLNNKKGVRVRLKRKPNDWYEAVAWSKWLIQHGYNIDLGASQINYRNLPKLGLTVEQAFDPCLNIMGGSQILKWAYVSASAKYGAGQKALGAALSAYNTGNHSAGFRNGYVAKVVRASTAGVAQSPVSGRSNMQLAQAPALVQRKQD